jgi:hypothetical protein
MPTGKELIGTRESMRELCEAYAKTVVGEPVAAAFRDSTFVYGTRGTQLVGLAVKKFFRNLYDRFVSKLESEGRGQGDLYEKVKEMREDLYFFDPGYRINRLINSDSGEPEFLQMMDYYYGEPRSTGFLKLRNEHIGRFLHEAMGWNNFSSFSPETLGCITHALIEGVKLGDKKQEARLWTPGKYDGDMKIRYFIGDREVAATMYMSFCIREAIKNYGGTLLFEGKEVTHREVCLELDDSLETKERLEKTELHQGRRFAVSTQAPLGEPNNTHWEGIELYPYLSGLKKYQGLSERRTLEDYLAGGLDSYFVAFGKGKLCFLWKSFPCVLTKRLLLDNWHYVSSRDSKLKEQEPIAITDLKGREVKRRSHTELNRATEEEAATEAAEKGWRFRDWWHELPATHWSVAAAKAAAAADDTRRAAAMKRAAESHVQD